MSKLYLPAYAEVQSREAAFLATDPGFGLTSVPAGVNRGLLELQGPATRNLAAFWYNGDRAWRVPARDEQVAAEWAAFAAVVPPMTIVEVAVGLLGHSDLHWRLIDVVQVGGDDIRVLPTTDRWRILLDFYRATLPGGRSLRLSRRELAHLVTVHDGKAAYAAEGPGRPGDRLAFRRLAAPYEEPWLVAPAGWSTRAGQ